MQAEGPRLATPRIAVRAVGLPLALLAVVYASWYLSDRLGTIGPFDRAAFGWAVVVPLALLTPGVVGLATAKLGRRARLLGATVIGLAITVVGTTGMALGTHQLGCRLISSPIEAVPPALVVSAVAAIGFSAATAASGSLAASVRRWRVGPTLLVGGLIGVVAIALTIVVFVAIFPALSCAALT